MVTEVDKVCGNILEKLEEQGVLNETMIIFTTDNGNMHGEHGLAEKCKLHRQPRIYSVTTGHLVWLFSILCDSNIKKPSLLMLTQGLPMKNLFGSHSSSRILACHKI